jgi:quinol monooxygenase YgiN
MIIKIVEYTIKEKALAEVLAAIEVFVRAVREHESGGFYEAYRKGETLEFVHLMKFPDSKAEETHMNAVYTNVFVKVLYPNCEKEPVFIDLDAIE